MSKIIKYKYCNNEIKKRRKKDDVSQIDFARELNISVAVLRNVEDNFALPTYSLRVKLSSYFGVSMKQIFFIDEVKGDNKQWKKNTLKI